MLTSKVIEDAIILIQGGKFANNTAQEIVDVMNELYTHLFVSRAREAEANPKNPPDDYFIENPEYTGGEGLDSTELDAAMNEGTGL